MKDRIDQCRRELTALEAEEKRLYQAFKALETPFQDARAEWAKAHTELKHMEDRLIFLLELAVTQDNEMKGETESCQSH